MAGFRPPPGTGNYSSGGTALNDALTMINEQFSAFCSVPPLHYQTPGQTDPESEFY